MRGSVQNFLRSNSKKSLHSQGNMSVGKGNLSDRSRSNKSDNSAKRIEPRKNLMSVAQNSKFVMNTRTINRGMINSNIEPNDYNK